MFQFCTYTFLTVLTVDLLATSGELTLTWTSPVLPKLHSNNTFVNPLGRPITSNEESWIASLVNIGALIGPLPMGVLSSHLGRKVGLLCIAIPYIISFFILAFLQDVYWYYFARLLAGLSGGAGCSILPLYIAEIAEDSNRGMLSVTMNIFWTFGSLVPYVLGPYMDLVYFNLVLACIPAIFFVLFFFIGPESPYYLVAKNKINEAEESLMRLRSRSRSVVAKEIVTIQETQQRDNNGSFAALFANKANRKALAISVALIVFQQFSGINAVLFYTQLIFQLSGSDLPSEISSMVIGGVLFLSSLILPFFADTLGRKILLIISTFGSMLSLFLFGAYFFFKDNLQADVQLFQWLPIVALVFYIIFYNLGLGCIPWTVTSELLPVNVKAVGTAVVSVVCFLCSFLVTKFFNNLNEAVGKAGSFWIFSCCCLMAALFVIFFLPETKGKSFEEIRKNLEK